MVLVFKKIPLVVLHLFKKWLICQYLVILLLLSNFVLYTGWAQLIRSHSARFCFKLSRNLNETLACNSNFGQNFELKITLN